MKQKKRTRRSLLLFFALLAFFVPTKSLGDTREAVLETNNACSSITFANSGSYGWVWDSTNSRLRSNNYKVNSSDAQTTISFTTIISSTFSFDYAVSSESNYDYLTITLDGVTIVNDVSGSASNTYTKYSLASGSHTLVLKYHKDNSTHSGEDRAYVSNMKFKSNATAYDFSSGGIYYKIHDALKRSVYVSFQSYYSGGDYSDESWTSGYSGSVTIPSSVSYGGNTYSVTGIGAHAFDNSSVTSVTLPNTIAAIKACAFTYCTNLTTIALPSALTEISHSAFSSCSRLSSITIPAQVTNIGNYAFYGCSALGSVTSLATTPPTLGTTVFSTTTFSMASLVVPKGCKTKYQTDEKWKSFVSISEEGKTWSATRGNAVITKNETSATISLSTTSAFEWDWNSTSHKLQTTNYNVNSSTSQTTATITTNSKTFISFDYGVSSETYDKLTITLDGVTLVNGINGDVTSRIGKIINSGTHTLLIKYEKNSTNKSGTDMAYIANMEFESLEGKENYGEVGNGSALWYEYDNVNKVLTVHGKGAWGASGKDTPRTFKNIEKEVKKIVVSDGVTTIGDWAFPSFGNAEEVVLPNSIISIGAYAFADGYSFKRVNLPNSLKSIGDYAFGNWIIVEHIDLPNSLQTIGKSAFYRCFYLESISIPNSVTSIGDEAFWACRSLKSVSLGTGITTIPYLAFEHCSDLTSLVIPSNITSIVNNAFWHCM